MARNDFPRTLSRILGPAESELGCDECFARIDHYAELRVAGANADSAVPGMWPHLLGCPACREEYETLLALLRGEDA